MKKNNVKIIVFVAVGLWIIILEVIFYAWLDQVLTEDVTFLGLPFDLPMFIFAVTTGLLIPVLCYLFSIDNKVKKVRNL